MFNPLVHFNVALELKSVDRNRENIVFKDIFRFGVACHVDRLAIIVLIDFVAICLDKLGFRLI